MYNLDYCYVPDLPVEELQKSPCLSDTRTQLHYSKAEHVHEHSMEVYEKGNVGLNDDSLSVLRNYV